MIPAPCIQDMCTLVRKLMTLLWVKAGKGWEGVLPVDKGDFYIKILSKFYV